jgi:hypothetical protein
MAGIALCDKCVEDEKQIAHYQQLARTIPDQKALDAINDLIMELRSAAPCAGKLIKLPATALYPICKLPSCRNESAPPGLNPGSVVVEL